MKDVEDWRYDSEVANKSSTVIPGKLAIASASPESSKFHEIWIVVFAAMTPGRFDSLLRNSRP